MIKKSEWIKRLIEISTNNKVIVVCNTKSITPKFYRKNSDFDPKTEFLSDSELEEIIAMLYRCGLEYDIYYDEIDFIQAIIANVDQLNDIVVYNSAQSGRGAGRKSLIPAFCQLCGIKVTGSNPYVVSLCRNKYHVNKLLSSHGFSVPSTYCYDNGWIMGVRPPSGMKIIIKPNYESSSIGIDQSSVTTASDSEAFQMMIMEKQRLMGQPIVVQEFISGYEVEVPCIAACGEHVALNPIGLKMKNGEHVMNLSILDGELKS